VVVAVRLPAGPAFAVASVATEFTRPPPEPLATERTVCPAGVVHPVTAELFALQTEMTTSPLAGTVVVGVAYDVPDVCDVREAEAATGDDAFVPEYASNCTVPCTIAGNVTLTFVPWSVDVATLLHAVVVTAVPAEDVPI
jgi:hypothetical protein